MKSSEMMKENSENIDNSEELRMYYLLQAIYYKLCEMDINKK